MPSASASTWHRVCVAPWNAGLHAINEDETGLYQDVMFLQTFLAPTDNLHYPLNLW